MTGQTQEYVAVAKLDDLPPGEKLQVDVLGQEVALFNVDGEIYAIGDICTHAYTHLTEGDFYEDIRGCWVVECPLHGSEFDVKTGEAVTLPATGNAGKYDVKVVDGEIFVSASPVVPYTEQG
jgi:3-phenylpropionate/trans-cinnamate dioxygenase ferredoxin component